VLQKKPSLTRRVALPFFALILLLSPQGVRATTEKPSAEATTITVTGRWEFLDKSNSYRILRHARIEVMDADSSASADTTLATTYTDDTGAYTATISSNESNGPDIYVRVFARDDNRVWVGDSTVSLANNYFALTDTKSNWITPTLDFQTYAVSSASKKEAFFIYSTVADQAQQFLREKTTWNELCSSLTTACIVPIKWSATSTDGSYYDVFGDKAIHLNGGDRYDPDVILHEYGHFVMSIVFTRYPDYPNCSPHFWSAATSNGCAWTEGWADFFQGAIQNDAFYDDTENNTIHFELEPPIPYVGGPDSESAVVASLWDLYDGGSNEKWDELESGFNGKNSNGIWETFLTSPSDILEFKRTWIRNRYGHDCKFHEIFKHHKIDSGSCSFLPVVIR
jgi:hypothetical protein